MRVLLWLCFFPLQLEAQSLAGLWVGHLAAGDSLLPYELLVETEKDKLTGFAQMTFRINGVENVGMKTVRLKQGPKTINLEDYDLVYNNYSTPPKRVKLYAKLQLGAEDDYYILTGTFFTRAQDMKAKQDIFSKGTVFLRKTERTPASNLWTRVNNMGLVKPQAGVANPVIIPGDSSSVNIGEASASVQSASRMGEPVAVGDTMAAVVANPPETAPPASKAASVTTATGGATNPANAAATPPAESSATRKKGKASKSQDLTSPAPGSAQPASTGANPATTGATAESTASPTAGSKKSSPDAASGKGREKNAGVSADPGLKTVARPKKPELPDPSTRITEIIDTIWVSTDSLLVSLYDNGEVDGDTVSVFLNQAVVLERAGLSAALTTFTISLASMGADSALVVLFANNMGSIPPNTGQLILLDGKVRHVVGFSSDLKKNPAILLRRRKP